jgi:hypothetical protein
MTDFRRFSISRTSFKIALKGNAHLQDPLACSFEQIVW